MDPKILIYSNKDPVRHYALLSSVFPDGFHDVILQVMQTTSVSIFNDQMKSEQLAYERDKAHRRARELQGLSVDPLDRDPLERVKDLLSLSKTLYQTYRNDNRWTPKGGSGNSKPSLNLAGAGETNKTGAKRSKQKCWNCGKPGCTPANCDKPLDESRIEKNRKEYYDEKSRRLNPNAKKSGELYQQDRTKG